MHTATSKKSWTRHLGTIIGYEGWVIGLSFVLLPAAPPLDALSYILPSAILCLGLALSAVVALELLEQHPANTPALRTRTLWALLLTHMGIMLLILNEWIMPGMKSNEDIQEILRATHSLQTVPAWVVWGMLAAGCLLMLQSAKQILRLDADSGAEQAPIAADENAQEG